MEFDLGIFSSRLENLMKSINITQTALSREIGISNVTISRYLTGERCPRIDVVASIADFFNVSIDYLIGRTDNRIIKYSINDLDFNIDYYIRNLYGITNRTHLTKRQIDALNILLFANQDFIMLAK